MDHVKPPLLKRKNNDALAIVDEKPTEIKIF